MGNASTPVPASIPPAASDSARAELERFERRYEQATRAEKVRAGHAPELGAVNTQFDDFFATETAR